MNVDMLVFNWPLLDARAYDKHSNLIDDCYGQMTVYALKGVHGMARFGRHLPNAPVAYIELAEGRLSLSRIDSVGNGFVFSAYAPTDNDMTLAYVINAYLTDTIERDDEFRKYQENSIANFVDDVDDE